MEFKHVSVLLEESIQGLNIKEDGIYADGTLGGGGHSYEIAKRLTTGRLIGIDQDEDAIKAAGKRLEEFKDRVTIVRDNYMNMRSVLTGLGIDKVDGILLDLGVSSYQFDEAKRGFSYREDAPLDMRMDRRRALTAGQVVNEYSESDLFRVIRDYGEDKFAKNIAKHIVAARQEKPIETTLELAEVIKGAIPAKFKAGKGHPAKQTFQAIRIEVNGELDVLKSFLETAPDMLNKGGRLCIITFHSLEDRMVKETFRKLENPCICPPGFPVCTCGRLPQAKLVGKPITAGAGELQSNNRAKSARLRIIEKI